MHIRTSLPFLTLFFSTLFACNGGTATDGGDTGAGGAGGTGGGSGLPACMELAEPAMVYACVAHPGAMSVEHYTDYAFTGAATVMAVRPKALDEPCLASLSQVGSMPKNSPHFEAPETMIDVVDAMGTMLTLGIVAPGFSPSTVAVGDTLDIDFIRNLVGGGYFDALATRLRIERGGELLVAVGHNDPAGISFEEGVRECEKDWWTCDGKQRIAMQLQDAQGNTVSIPNGTSAEVDELLVTNAWYFENFTNGCNYSIAVETLVSAAPKP
ncbi:hypothetical protein [Polyangium sp. 15x6]|uniref:hypothetical protein n=1 Tax=Polyangium sp. 15x6 TaxID=3042687 RepID=UPI00249A1183|nr:hypothetical protein [Polyangium sp. 15x6]MDI3282830.1 hypothetical protein [Polyangium sp. 15x6]